jgi:hypothetical protein
MVLATANEFGMFEHLTDLPISAVILLGVVKRARQANTFTVILLIYSMQDEIMLLITMQREAMCERDCIYTCEDFFFCSALIA